MGWRVMNGRCGGGVPSLAEKFAFTTPKGNEFAQEYEVYSQRFQKEDFGDDEPFDTKMLPNDEPAEKVLERSLPPNHKLSYDCPNNPAVATGHHPNRDGLGSRLYPTGRGGGARRPFQTRRDPAFDDPGLRRLEHPQRSEGLVSRRRSSLRRFALRRPAGVGDARPGHRRARFTGLVSQAFSRALHSSGTDKTPSVGPASRRSPASSPDLAKRECVRDQARRLSHGVTATQPARFSAWSRSVRISSMCSRPTLRRTRSGVMPPARCAASSSCECVVVAG